MGFLLGPGLWQTQTLYEIRASLCGDLISVYALTTRTSQARSLGSQLRLYGKLGLRGCAGY